MVVTLSAWEALFVLLFFFIKEVLDIFLRWLRRKMEDDHRHHYQYRHRRYHQQELELPLPNSERAPEIKLLYVTPEKVSSSSRLLSVFDGLHRNGFLARFVVDKAHCVSQWGHDFRPDYTKLNALKATYDNAKIPILALTATTTPKLVTDTRNRLAIPEFKLFISSFVRSNLKYEVIQRKVNILQDVMKKMMKQFGDKTAGIIYCLSRKNCETTARTLRGWNFKVDVYHAGLSDGFRTVVQRQWQANEVNVIRATIAFGMGIDKPDVRYVIHIALPKSIEGYYQETDRVGRDRVPFYCPLLYNYSDIIQLRKMIEGDGGVHVRAAVRGPCRVGDDGLCRIDPKGQRRRSGQNYFQGISMFLKMVFTFMVLAAHTMKADASEEEEEEFDIFKLRTSSFGCPLMILDDPCPEENLLYYFSCCGEIEDERYCCFKLQDWELVLILPVTCVALIIIVRIFYLRCFHGSHKRTTKLPSNLPSSSSPRALSTLSPSNSASLDFENANSLMLLPIRELHHHSIPNSRRFAEEFPRSSIKSNCADRTRKTLKESTQERQMGGKEEGREERLPDSDEFVDGMEARSRILDEENRFEDSLRSKFCEPNGRWKPSCHTPPRLQAHSSYSPLTQMDRTGPLKIEENSKDAEEIQRKLQEEIVHSAKAENPTLDCLRGLRSQSPVHSPSSPASTSIRHQTPALANQDNSTFNGFSTSIPSSPGQHIVSTPKDVSFGSRLSRPRLEEQIELISGQNQRSESCCEE